MSLGRRQAIIWTNGGILFIGPLRAHFSETLIRTRTLSFKGIHLKESVVWKMAAISSPPQFVPQEVIYAIMNIPLGAIQLAHHALRPAQVVIMQTEISYVFYRTIICVWFKFHRRLFLRRKGTRYHLWRCKCPGNINGIFFSQTKRTAIHWRVYVSPGLKAQNASIH